MPVIRYIIHNSKELDFLENNLDVPVETIRAIAMNAIKTNVNHNIVSIFIDNANFVSWSYDCNECLTKYRCTLQREYKDVEDVDVKQLLRERKLNRII